jgi:hypothetical protein
MCKWFGEKGHPHAQDLFINEGAMCSIEEGGVFAARWTHYEFLLGRGFIRINIKHPTKRVR